jgi:hypothetical protein
MEIIVEIHVGKDGRPTGTVRAANTAQGHSFSGNLQLLALVENLYLGQDDTAPLPSDEAGDADDNIKGREQ